MSESNFEERTADTELRAAVAARVDDSADQQALLNQIAATLLDKGFIDSRERAQLRSLAAVPGLDAEGLQALIAQVTLEQRQRLQPVINFREHLQQTVNEAEYQLDSDELDSLVTAGQQIGWDAAKVTAMVKTEEADSAKRQRPAGKGSPVTMVFAALILLAVAVSWVYEKLVG